ncbi:MAG: hypothetical protein HKN20_10440, partial [Gemmatimonadetes bacterium]|nr:hypothetical protein [Gemmatimonadota bacterium]
IGFAYLAVMVLMMSRSAKPYYLSPFYPVLFAAGALVFERVARLRYAGWLRPATVIMLVLSGAALAPVAKPLLPVDTYVAYAERLGIAPGSDERHETGRLPQFFADMHGWQELAHAVAAVYDALPAEDRDRACIFARHYGQAGAIDFYGPGLGLPRAIAGHNNYWLWGPGDCDGGVMIVIGGEREDHERSFAVVEEAGLFTCRDCLPMEDNQVLYVCRDLRASPADIWARVKHYD